MKRKDLIGYVSVVIFLLLMEYCGGNYFANNACKARAKRINETIANGKIKDFYLDKSSHMNETIIVDSEDGELLLIIPNDNSGLFSYVQKGDSIVKSENSMNVRIVRNQKSKLFVVDFDCDNRFN